MSAQLWRARLSIARSSPSQSLRRWCAPAPLKHSPARHDRMPRRQNSPDRWSIPPTHASGSTPDPIVQARGGAAAAVGFLAVGRLDSAKPQGSAYRIRTGPCTLGEERAQEWEPARQSPLTASGPRTRPESGLVQSSTVRRRRHASPAAHRLASLPGSSRGIGGSPRAARAGCASGSCSGARQAWNTAKDASRNSADNALAKTQRQARGPKQTGSGPGDERTGRRTRCCARFSCRRSVSRMRLCAGTLRKVTKTRALGETVTATARCRSRGPAAPASPAG